MGLTEHYHHHHDQFLNREGRWGTTDDFATSFLHFSLFSTALLDLPNSRPVHSLMLSSHLFLCPPLQIVKMLRLSRTSRKTVLDSMMEAMEEYTHHLEDRVAESSAEMTLAKQNLETFLSDTLPPHLVSRLANGETTKLATGDAVQGKVYDNLGVVMIEVVNVRDALLHVPPKELLLFLNDLYVGVDDVVRRYGAYR